MVTRVRKSGDEKKLKKRGRKGDWNTEERERAREEERAPPHHISKRESASWTPGLSSKIWALAELWAVRPKDWNSPPSSGA